MCNTLSTALPAGQRKPAKSGSESHLVERFELLALCGMLSLFLVICFAIQSRYIPWNDEVQFVDPAANLYYGQGFISTEWSNQTSQTFWCGNAPVYPALLFLTFRAFGFSQLAARCVNYCTMALAVLALWGGVRRLRLLEQVNTRLLLVLFALTGYGGYVCYSNLRYDALCVLECALALLAFSLQRSVFRSAGLFLTGAAMLLTNFQLLQYTIVLAVIVVWVHGLGLASFKRLSFLYLGMMAGGLSLMWIYQAHAGALSMFGVTLRQQAGQSLAEKLRSVPAYFQYDLTQFGILLALAASWFMTRRSGDKGLGRSVLSGVLLCTILPAFFFLTRRYVFSSAWMVTIPASLFLCRLLEANVPASRTWKAVVMICCATAMGAGLPRALAGIVNEWSIRNYATVDSFVSSNVKADDVAYCDPAAYFAMKPRTARLYGPGYLDVINAEEKRAITVVVVNPVAEKEVLARIGGRWMATQTLIRETTPGVHQFLPIKSHFSCRLTVWRRPLGDGNLTKRAERWKLRSLVVGQRLKSDQAVGSG